MGTKKLETYETPSCKVYDLELEAAVMATSPNILEVDLTGIVGRVVVIDYRNLTFKYR